MSDEITAREWVHEQVRERVEPEPDGRQDAHGSLFTGTRQLVRDGKKFSTDFDSDEIEDALDELVIDGEIISWHGILFPADEEHLRAVIANENQAGIPRLILIRKVKKNLDGVTA